ncbi:MAG TPA: right-handed parallel beta-helix repeat-containing protein [Candidatus Limnocylindria bacterium]|nr:right-handed parallel beta-helix repeat-containing protein [Candidatus Limnocylindria bacterium]
MKPLLSLLACIAVSSEALARELPVVVVTQDDTKITRSCRISIPPGTILADRNTNGVLQIEANNITIEFAPDTELRGANRDTPWNELAGIGISINGHRGVTLLSAKVHGFKNGVVAINASGLEIDGGDFSDNYRQRLRSTPALSDDADWMFPHHNDETKWRDEYGGALCVESSDKIEIHGVTIRRGQNGILLDRVNRAKIYDNDCSFLSGWGLALWRSSDNIISRNALDFCVRGHVEGVYNRGNDSAGILCFEQSSRNTFIENSVTHGGDGFFGFAGQEAIGEHWMNAERARLRTQTGKEDVDDLIKVPADEVKRLSPLGCNDNLLIGNDFSYASAHGIEMTFSKRNQYINNRVVENAICGFWGGYSSASVIAGNNFEGNGGMAYGLERGGINMEHAANNLIIDNQFINNRCALHFWWNPSPLLKFPGIVGTPTDVAGNIIWGNHFTITDSQPFGALPPGPGLYILQLRGGKTGHVHHNLYAGNTLNLNEPHAQELAVEPGAEPFRSGTEPKWRMPKAKAIGSHHPVGARPSLRGRKQILMDEWGPWDHESPLFRPGVTDALGETTWDLYGVSDPVTAEVLSGNVTLRQERLQPPPEGPVRLRLTAPAGVTEYRIKMASPGFSRVIDGTSLVIPWDVVFFPSSADPLESLERWRSSAMLPEAVHLKLNDLDFPFGMGGPRNLKLSDELTRRGPGRDHFGMMAHTKFPLPVGRWRLVSMSDDGVRVRVNGQTVIENWNIHGGTENEAYFEQKTPAAVDFAIEYFERDGAAMFRFGIERAK